MLGETTASKEGAGGGPLRVWRRITGSSKAEPETPDITETSTRRLEETPKGYPRLATFLQSSEANFSLYRSFSYLHSRILLTLQEEISSLERELDELDWDGFADDGGVVATTGPKGEERTRGGTLGDIRDKLVEYDEVLIKARTLKSYQRPRNRDYRSVRGWLRQPENIVYSADNNPKVRRNGIKVLINGRPADAFGDTGSTENIVDEKYVRKRNLSMTPRHSEMVMVNGTKLHSPGYVELDVGFAGENESPTTIIAMVVKHFPFDILLSHTFLETTQTLKKHLCRFTRIMFPRLTASLSMNLLSSGANGSLFNASFDDGIDFGAVLDTGSNCNTIDEDWALSRGLHIYREDGHHGWISLPSKGWVPTVGRVYVDINLPNGTTIPISLEVLKAAAVPVIIGVDTILDHGLFTAYPEALLERYEDEAELFHMNFKSSWLVKAVAKAKQLCTSSEKTQAAEPVTRQSEAERRWAWDKKYRDGKTAPRDEWEQEYTRRYQYERASAAGNGPGINVRLIKELPPDYA
ncbi:hypothetical protein K469DRAFT_750803 [Zopfia rhizophila CBS 207.26]|uniref:DUF6594 domain-containing protein n=1 Tax=Zopfia rhizophila CBS 207.26 TaxID=1314779 RepID=A0A6A6E3A0_9PEZI|nr:hypothetical protein K469DRAFT_750803 [Zopfia rhizophila CBS 207.26]